MELTSANLSHHCERTVEVMPTEVGGSEKWAKVQLLETQMLLGIQVSDHWILQKRKSV